MEPARFGYRTRIIQRKLWINSGLAAVGVAYAALHGLSYALIDGLILALIGVSAYRIVQSLIILYTRPPAITVTDHGLRDAHLGDMLIPWAAINHIKAFSPYNRLGVGLLLMVDAAQFDRIPGPITGKLANLVVGSRPGRRNVQMALMMTPVVVLDTTLGDLVSQIRARERAAHIPIEWSA